MNLVYLIGEPGSGKTTVTRALTAGLNPTVVAKPNFRFTEWHARRGIWCLEPGWPRPGFGGTDTLGLSALPHAVAWIGHAPHPLVIAEGDRLAHPRFWEAAQHAGYRVDVLALAASPESLDARRRTRRSNQDSRWLAGRRTRFANLVASWPVRVLDADRPPDEVLGAVLATVPALRR